MASKKILIVDDEDDLRNALNVALTNAGYTTFTAANGAEGLKIALAEKPDLILLDIMMPNMSGHETLKELRKNDWGKAVPVLFLTNMDDATNISQGFGLKGNGYIIKSNTSLEEITKKVKQYLAGYHD